MGKRRPEDGYPVDLDAFLRNTLTRTSMLREKLKSARRLLKEDNSGQALNRLRETDSLSLLLAEDIVVLVGWLKEKDRQMNELRSAIRDICANALVGQEHKEFSDFEVTVQDIGRGELMLQLRDKARSRPTRFYTVKVIENQ